MHNGTATHLLLLLTYTALYTNVLTEYILRYMFIHWFIDLSSRPIRDMGSTCVCVYICLFTHLIGTMPNGSWITRFDDCVGDSFFFSLFSLQLFIAHIVVTLHTMYTVLYAYVVRARASIENFDCFVQSVNSFQVCIVLSQYFSVLEARSGSNKFNVCDIHQFIGIVHLFSSLFLYSLSLFFVS